MSAYPVCTCTETHPTLTEEMILNYDALPPSMKGWRQFRIEYGFECACPEGVIWLPPTADPDKIEIILNGGVSPWGPVEDTDARSELYDQS